MNESKSTIRLFRSRTWRINGGPASLAAARLKPLPSLDRRDRLGVDNLDEFGIETLARLAFPDAPETPADDRQTPDLFDPVPVPTILSSQSGDTGGRDGSAREAADDHLTDVKDDACGDCGACGACGGIKTGNSAVSLDVLPRVQIQHEQLKQVMPQLWRRLSTLRRQIVRQGVSRRVDRLLDWTVNHVVTHPSMLRVAVLPLRLLQMTGIYDLLERHGELTRLPTSWQRLLRLVSHERHVWPSRPQPITRAGGVGAILGILHRNALGDRAKRRTTVALLDGCVAGLMSDLTRKAVELLAACGADVICPPSANCCGGLCAKGGQAALDHARDTIDICRKRPTRRALDAVVAPLAHCGDTLKSYASLLADDPAYAAPAADLAQRVISLPQLLLDLGLPPLHVLDMQVAYHAPCGTTASDTDPTRALLDKIPGLRVVPLASGQACGGVDALNLHKPIPSPHLADGPEASLWVAADTECMIHLQAQAAESGQPRRVYHVIDLFYTAAFGV